MTDPLANAREGLMVRLEARLPDDSSDWTPIYPAQLEWMAKEGNQVRAIEVSRCEVQTGEVTEKAIHDAIANAFSNGVVTYSAVRQAAKDVLALTSSAAQALPTSSPHVEYSASRGQSKVTYWVSREEGDRIRAAAVSSASREGGQ